jgi:hypothetical protein
VSTDPGAFSQNSWIAAMKAQMQAKYPKMQLVDIGYGQNKPTESFSAAQDLISKHRGQLDAIVVPSVVALPKVAEAVEQAGLADNLVVTGMSTPNQIREFVKRGAVKTVVLWNPVDLGYLAVYAAQASLAGTLKDNAVASQAAGRTVGHARRGRIARGHHGQGSAHPEERDRVGESVPIHEGQHRPVQLLSRERRETMQGGRKREEGEWTVSSSVYPHFFSPVAL